MTPTPAPRPEPKPPAKPNPKGAPQSRWAGLIWAVLMVALVAALFATARASSNTPTPIDYTYDQFIVAIDAKTISEVTIDTEGGVKGTLNDGRTFQTRIPIAAPQDDLTDRLLAAGVKIKAKGPAQGWGAVLLSLAPILLLVGFVVWMGRRGSKGAAGGFGGFSRSKATVVDAQRPSTTFADIAGYEGAKSELLEVVDYLRNPERYHRAGAVGPGGVLMVGPPGTGKTLIARAIAGEADVTFFSVTGSSFVELFVGVGAARVRDLFAEARKRAPAIVFIDEIDAIGQRRGGHSFGGNDEREQTLDQLLAEMDGFDPAVGLVVLAATNRPDVLDPALLRPGRFDRQVVIPLPNQTERLAILGVHCRSKKLGPDVDLAKVARGTPGFSGADLANLANEAAIVAVRDSRDVLSAGDFDAARDRLILGRREKGAVLLDDERHLVAVHEAGHALVAALSRHADPVEKVSILPSGAALGATHQLPVDERHLYAKSWFDDALTIRLAGRAAELIVAGEGSSGAADDLASATELATRMIRDFGLSEEMGPVSYGGRAQSYVEEPLARPPVSEATLREIDLLVVKALRAAGERADVLLRSHRVELDRLAAMLEELEVVDGSAVYQLLTPGPVRSEQLVAAVPVAVPLVSGRPRPEGPSAPRV